MQAMQGCQDADDFARSLGGFVHHQNPPLVLGLMFYDAVRLSPSECHIFKELRPSDGRSGYIATDGRRPCDGARRCQAFSWRLCVAPYRLRPQSEPAPGVGLVFGVDD